MAQPTTQGINGVPSPANGDNAHALLAGKRKRDSEDEVMDEDAEGSIQSPQDTPATPSGWDDRDHKQLVQNFYEILQRCARPVSSLFGCGNALSPSSLHHLANKQNSIDVEPSILKFPLAEVQIKEEHQAKRQKSVDPSLRSNIADKIAAGEYTKLDELVDDVTGAIEKSISDLESRESEEDEDTKAVAKSISKLHEFKRKAMELFRREQAYPRTASESAVGTGNDEDGEIVLSLVGYAPQERRLFSSLPLSKGIDLTDAALPSGLSIARVAPSETHEKSTKSLGELFGSPRALPPLQPPKPPKTQAKSNNLDFYHPALSEASRHRGNNYFNTKLTAGYYLDYSNATPSSRTVPKQRERAESLAGKRPSIAELATSEVESLFRGAFSSFAPTKDDSTAVVPSNIAGRVWWQRTGQRNFERMIEAEYYGKDEQTKSKNEMEIDEDAIRDAIENWDDSLVDPSLESIMGSKTEEQRDADEILEEVSDMIETLASYQRIRNLTLPNSQNRSSSDPVNGDMLANEGPQPSEQEQATYEVLKAQLALIVKTLPPYAVAKLNGDQLDELLISTKVQVQSDQYKGTMEEDDAGVQARIRAQQAAHAAQAQQAQQAQARPAPQRTASVSGGQYPNQYQAAAQYGTPGRTPAHQQMYRTGPNPNFQQQRNFTAPPGQHRPPQPNQYTRQNGFQSQFATQLAKAQTPYGHQNMPQYAGQQRPQYGQTPQQGTPNPRFYQQQNFPAPATPTPTNYGGYANGAQQRNMTPQMGQRQPFSPSANAQQNRFSTPSQGPGLTGYHTVIPEAQQQRILEQAKARVAAQERSAMFGDKMGTPGFSPGMNAMRMNGTPPIPQKVTPVPVPVIPGGPPPPQGPPPS